VGERFLELRSIERRFSGGRGLVAVDLTIERGEMLALIGPSGSGKSTLLRLIAGLDRPDRGEIRLDGRPIAALGPVERGVGMTLDDAALYDHLSVRENLRAGLDRFGLGGGDAERAAYEAAELVGALGLLDRLPPTLSAGERRRASLARAIARKPRILLLDEPLAHLDERTRLDLREDIRLVHEATGAATVLVTHDHHDALAIADRLAYLDEGRILQTGSSTSFREPDHLSVARGCPWLGLEVCRAEAMSGPTPAAAAWVAFGTDALGQDSAPEDFLLEGVVRYRTTEVATPITPESREGAASRGIVLTVELRTGERVRLAPPTGQALSIGAACRIPLRAAPLRWFDAAGHRLLPPTRPEEANPRGRSD
jgi:ABC-type sulfate/molybdate transport systems ATPase subunit